MSQTHGAQVPGRSSTREMLWRFFWRPGLKLLGFLIFLLAGWLVACFLLAAHFERRAENAGETGSEPLSAIAAQFPRTDVNAAAKRLEELSASMGIDTATKNMADRSRPRPEANAEWEAVKGAFSKWARNDVIRADDLLIPLPNDVAAFLERHQAQIVQIRDHLSGTDAPIWEFFPERNLSGPLPSAGVVSLGRVLMADAFHQEWRGHAENSRRDLGASWRLNQSLRGRPELVSQVGALAIDKMHQRFLRVIRDVPREWEGRIREYDLAEWQFRTLRWEAWAALRLSQERMTDEREGLGWKLTTPFLAPYIRMGLAEHAFRLHGMAVDFRKLSPCRLDTATLEKVGDRQPPPWNKVGTVAWGESFRSVPIRMLRRRLDHELTALVLRLKRGENLPDPFPSSVCPGEVWTWTLAADGHAREVRFGRRLEEVYDASSWELPLTWLHRKAMP